MKAKDGVVGSIPTLGSLSNVTYVVIQQNDLLGQEENTKPKAGGAKRRPLWYILNSTLNPSIALHFYQA